MATEKDISIVYLTPYFWPERIGSAPYCTELALWLTKQGAQVRVISMRPHYPNPDEFLPWLDGSRDNEELEGVQITRVASRGRGDGGAIARIRNDLGYLASIVRHAFAPTYRTTSVVIVNVPSVLGLLGALVFKFRFRAKVIAVVHDIESGLSKSLKIGRSRILPAIARGIEKITFSRADELVVLTEAMRREVRAMGVVRPISVIPIWASLPEASAICTSELPTVMYSGNFGKKQNLDQLLPFIERVTRERRPLRLVFQGDGSERRRFESAVLSLGANNVEFRSLVSADRLMQSLQAANVHLVTQAIGVADYSLPSKLISIMASGRPFVCIAEEGSTLHQITAESRAGVCVAPGNHAEFYDAVTSLAQDYDAQTRLGENGRQFIAMTMNKSDIMLKYEQLIYAGQQSHPTRSAPTENVAI
jgi:colanic acid biosynthesis glycosyl transferase WcaI